MAPCCSSSRSRTVTADTAAPSAKRRAELGNQRSQAGHLESAGGRVQSGHAAGGSITRRRPSQVNRVETRGPSPSGGCRWWMAMPLSVAYWHHS